ncbi:MAG: DHHA1 domain-containing protein [Nanoarchaeota archaeon]
MGVLKRFDDFVSNLKETDRICIFFDPDPDGISAAVIANKAIERLRGRKADMVMYQEHGDLEIKEENIAKLKSNGINKIFIMDLAVDQYPEKVREVSEFAEICILDHHKVYNDLNSERIVHLKPQMFDSEEPSSYITAKMSYDLFMKHVDISDMDWLAAVGILGDAAWRRWKDFVSGVCRRYGIDFNKLLESKIGNVMRLIASAPEFGFGVIAECFDVVSNAKSFEDVERSSLVKYRDIIGNEMYRLMKEFKRNAETHDDVIFFFMRSKYSVGSTLSTRMSFKQPDKTVIVIQDAGEDFYRVSLRRQDFKVKVNDLVSEATKDLENASGGGHVPAAGGRIMKRDLERFKSNILRILGKA